MRPCLSLLFLAPALLAQSQETPFSPNALQEQQRQTVLIQPPPQVFCTSVRGQLHCGPASPQKTFRFTQAAPQTEPYYWNFQAPPAPERIQVQQVPATPNFPIGNPTPKPLKILRRNLHFYANPNPKVCSIPLINALNGKAPHPDKIAIPAAPSNLKEDVVPPPAPPCDDGKR